MELVRYSERHKKVFTVEELSNLQYVLIKYPQHHEISERVLRCYIHVLNRVVDDIHAFNIFGLRDNQEYQSIYGQRKRKQRESNRNITICI